MTSLTSTNLTQLFRRAAIRATLAPSIHNTQPWRFVLRRDALEVYSDPDRRLRVIDPFGRQMVLSCGCAVFNARVSIAAAGYETVVKRFPDPLRPELVARLKVTGEHRPAVPTAALDEVVERRQTNRRRFIDEDVPVGVVTALINAAVAEGAELFPITRPEHRQATARLSQLADQVEINDPAYRAELRAWTTDDPRRTDGVPALVVPHVDAGSGDEIPIRDFDTRGTGWLPTATRSSSTQCLLLLGTSENIAAAWLRAGEALERVLLELTLRDYVASPLTQLIEVTRTNIALRHELGLQMYPHVLLRVGRAPATTGTRRRRLVDVLTEVP